MAFKKKSRFRSSVSLSIVLAMVLALVPVVGGAATPSTGVITAGSATNLTTVMGTSSDGLNGVVSVEVSGTMATKSKLTGTINAAAVAAGRLGDLNPAPAPEDYANFKVTYGSVATTITGLSANSTVGNVVTAIASQVPSVTTGYVPTWGYAFIEAKQVGNINIAITNNAVAAAVFGATRSGTAGVGYSGLGGSTIVTFTPTAGKPIVWSGHAVKFGYVDGAGAFKAGEVDPASLLHTAVKLPAGLDLVLATGDTVGFDAIGIAKGTATVTLSNGVRDFNAPDHFEVYEHGSWSDRTVEAGKETTMVVEIDNYSEDTTSAIDGATFTLPAGWSIPATAAVSAKVGSTDASATLAGNTVTVTNFNLVEDELKVILPNVKPAPTADDPKDSKDDYAFTGTYKNVGGAAFAPITGPEDPDEIDEPGESLMRNKIHVAPENKVKFIDLRATGNRAGGQSKVYARLYDQHTNEIRYDGDDYFEWERTVTFSNITSPALSPASQLLSTTDSVFDRNWGYDALVDLSTQQGVTKIQAVVAGEATSTVNIDTTGVGAPAKLVLSSEKNPAKSHEWVRFHVGLVDANGKATSFLTGGSKTYRLFKGEGGNSTEDVTIDQRQSESVVEFHAVATTWDMWAVDAYQGALLQSGVLKQVWGAAAPETPEYTDLKVMATTVVPVKDVYGWGTNDGQYGFAPVGSPITLKVQAVDQNGMPIIPKGTVTITAGGWGGQPGVISSDVATLGPDGSYTFTVTSTFPGTGFKGWCIEDDAKGIHVHGYTWHYSPKVDSLTASKGVGLANNTDTITLSAKVIDPMLGNPAAGVKIFFNADGGTLSSSEAITNAQGIASVTIKSAKVGLIDVSARTSEGSKESASVRFTDIEAVLQGSPTAQQSARGAWAKDVKVKLRKLDGTYLDLSADDIELDLSSWARELGATCGSAFSNARIINNEIVFDVSMKKAHTHDASVEQNLYPQMYVAGETAIQNMYGEVEIPGLFGETDYEFAGTLSIPVVNNATAKAADSTLPRVNGNILGSGFRPGSYGNGSTLTDGGDAEVYVVAPGFTEPIWAGYADVDAYGRVMDVINMPAPLAVGTYNMIVDGVMMVGGFRMDAGMALGVDPVYVTIAQTKTGVAGSVMDLNAARLGGSMVQLWRSTTGVSYDYVGTTLTNDAGNYAFTVSAPTKTTYFKAVVLADPKYFGGESAPVMYRSVASKSSLAITKAPASATANKAFSIAGSAPSHLFATKVSVRMYKKNSAGVYKYSHTSTFSLAQGKTSFTGSIKATSKGSWRFRIRHADADHFASYSSYKYVTVK